MSVRIERRKFVAQGGIRSEHPIDQSLIADQVKMVSTNGTTAVNVFGANGAPANITITSFIVGAKDTTAGNIALKQGSTTIASVAKGTSTGVVTIEEAALSSPSIGAGTAVTVVSSSAGNALCQITYTVDA
jgi:ABC-type lipopolysaccharide export system ATPase subunit